MPGVSKDGLLVSEYAAHPSRRALQALLRMRAKLKRASVQEEIRETSPCRGQCLQDRSHLPLGRFHAPAGIDQEMRAAAFRLRRVSSTSGRTPNQRSKAGTA